MVSLGNELNNYFSLIRDKERLTMNEERCLGWKWINDNDFEARDELIERNLGLVVHVAKKYLNKGVESEDLIGFGNIGLTKSAEGYDPALSVRFGTYAFRGIENSIKEGIRAVNIRGARIPKHMFKVIKDMDCFFEGCLSEGEILGFADYERYRNLNPNHAEMSKAAYSIFHGIKNSFFNPEILEKKVFLEDNCLERNEFLDKFRKAFNFVCEENGISERDKEIIILRYGLYNEVKFNSNEIGRHFGLTRERVRQICESTLNCFRNSLELKELIS